MDLGSVLDVQGRKSNLSVPSSNSLSPASILEQLLQAYARSLSRLCLISLEKMAMLWPLGDDRSRNINDMHQLEFAVFCPDTLLGLLPTMGGALNANKVDSPPISRVPMCICTSTIFFLNPALSLIFVME